MLPKQGSLASSCDDKLGRIFVERLPVVLVTEQISLAVVDRGNRGVAVHAADRAETYVGGGMGLSVDQIRARICPAASLVFTWMLALYASTSPPSNRRLLQPKSVSQQLMLWDIRRKPPI